MVKLWCSQWCLQICLTPTEDCWWKWIFLHQIHYVLSFISFRVPMKLCISAYEEIIALVLPCENESLIYGLVYFIENFSKSRVPWSTVKCFIQTLVFLFWQIRLMMLSKKHKEAFKVSVKSEFQQQQQRKGKIFWEILILSVCLFTACTDKLFNKKIIALKILICMTSIHLMLLPILLYSISDFCYCIWFFLMF